VLPDCTQYKQNSEGWCPFPNPQTILTTVDKPGQAKSRTALKLNIGGTDKEGSKPTGPQDQ
jgi:hypothetical protein